MLRGLTTAATNSVLRVGLYHSDAAGELPGALVADYGTQATTSVGVKFWTPPTPPVLHPGVLYFAACVAQTAAATFRSRASSDPLVGDPVTVTAGAALANAYWLASVTGALPATFGTPGGIAQAPAAGLRFGATA